MSKEFHIILSIPTFSAGIIKFLRTNSLSTLFNYKHKTVYIDDVLLFVSMVMASQFYRMRAICLSQNYMYTFLYVRDEGSMASSPKYSSSPVDVHHVFFTHTMDIDIIYRRPKL